MQISKKTPAHHTSISIYLFIDVDLSVRQYNMLRKVVNTVHQDCFPSYYLIAEAKKKLIPNDIHVSETSAEVPLQNILDKTAHSILNMNDFQSKNELILEC